MGNIKSYDYNKEQNTNLSPKQILNDIKTTKLDSEKNNIVQIHNSELSNKISIQVSNGVF